MPIYKPSQRKNIVLGLVLLLGIFLFYSMLSILTALLGSIILYTLFRPLHVYLTKKRGIRKSFSAIIIIVLSFLIIVIPMIVLSWMIINKLIAFKQNPELITHLIDKVNKLLGSAITEPELIKNAISNVSNWVIGEFSTFINKTFKVFINLMILYFSFFYMLVSYEAFEKMVLKYLPFQEKSSLRFGKELKNITYSNIFGQAIIAASQGFIVGIGFLIFQIPDPLFWAILSFFVCFLPVVGAPIIIIPAGIIELASGNIIAGVGILIFGLVLVTLVDYVLRFYISKRIADTHPLITLIGVIVGVPIFGLIGIVLGPLFISFFLLLVAVYEELYLKADNE